MYGSDALIVRPLSVSDRSGWGDLWAAYLDFYGTSRSQDIFDIYFDRLLGDDPQDYNGLVAEQNGTLVGLTHYLFHRHGWNVENTCYLQDLYATPAARGTGVGRKLIEGVYAAAEASGVPTVYWLTQDNNAEARKLYDRVATLTPFIKYQKG
ncbi:GNAT family N-acetyltransferase [uncultured Tateyamaria sp.]|uniref:GNAT family N-acetyltransferase n=1 Tax=Tateyamaria sp. TaxID=1929288 RepID=UPI0026273E9F|nr:GNAT family N-acetyltransferase [uncultured Tateyamaria sp.]